jgi:hypothetical protein
MVLHAKSKGLKAFCIAAIAANCSLLTFLIIFIFVQNKSVQAERQAIIMMEILTGCISISVLYAGLVLGIRRKYLLGAPPSKTKKNLIFIVSAPVILYSLGTAILTLFAAYATATELLRGSFQIQQSTLIEVSITLLIASVALLNTLMIVRSFQFMRKAKNSYIDDVLDSFDLK